ncbi:hypothetical protein [Streptomyces alkaliphilus]|uniref:Uncharacterized protein n=1 Tax=Streptomyces alkaliphilus TaxID=1472722 RepID=A0A646I6E6_9ACTN|nr:hypothetical protein [Streptomyces alkaliphilus]MQS06583.1 hypothetical protein [Streptomyces alkaliphilus]
MVVEAGEFGGPGGDHYQTTGLADRDRDGVGVLTDRTDGVEGGRARLAKLGDSLVDGIGYGFRGDQVEGFFPVHAAAFGDGGDQVGDDALDGNRFDLCGEDLEGHGVP